MTRAACLLLLYSFLAPPAFVQMPVERGGDNATERLEELLQAAASDGLLTTVGDGPAADESSDEGRPSLGDYSCPERDPLASLQLMQSHESEDLFSEDIESDERPIGTLIAEGFNTEALSLMGRDDGETLDGLRVIASFLEARESPDFASLRRLAGCFPNTGPFLTVALLEAGDPEAVEMLSNDMESFRRLPFRVRDALAGRAVPVLVERDQPLLAERMLADFSEDEFAQSGVLRFARVVGSGESYDSNVVEKLRELAIRPEFGRAAMSALSSRGAEMSPAQLEFLLSEWLIAGSTSSQGQNDDGFSDSLRQVLDYLERAGRVSEMVALSQSPIALEFDAEGLAATRAEAAAQAQLRSPNATMRLAALEALAGTDALAGHETLAVAYEAALDFGFLELAGTFGSVGTSDAAKRRTAEVAFALHRHSEIFALSSSNPDDELLRILALRSAMRDDNIEEFNAQLDRSALSSKHARDLLEEGLRLGKDWRRETLLNLAVDAQQEGEAARFERMIEHGYPGLLSSSLVGPVELSDIPSRTLEIDRRLEALEPEAQ